MPLRAAPTWVGTYLADGRYEVTAELGEGGMGRVYQAHDHRLGCDVVVKSPRPHLLADAVALDRFAREIRSLVRLQHPHILRINDVGEHEGVPYAVMQFLGGGTLEDRLRKGPGTRLTPQPCGELAQWLVSVAEALDFVHQKGYIHRDIKPSNVLFDDSGNSFISDFGTARAMESGDHSQSFERITGTGIMMGTLAYMAPEMAEDKFDGRVDQYALAVTVFEALSGRLPFHASSARLLLIQHQLEPPPSVSDLVADVPGEIAAAVQRALAKDPNQRFSTCGQFAEAVLSAAPLVKVVRVRPAGRFHCPSCGKRLRLPPDAAGKRARCPHCQGMVTAPTPTPAVAEPAAPVRETRDYVQERPEIRETVRQIVPVPPLPPLLPEPYPEGLEPVPRASWVWLAGGGVLAAMVGGWIFLNALGPMADVKEQPDVKPEMTEQSKETPPTKPKLNDPDKAQAPEPARPLPLAIEIIIAAADLNLIAGGPSKTLPVELRLSGNGTDVPEIDVQVFGFPKSVSARSEPVSWKKRVGRTELRLTAAAIASDNVIEAKIVAVVLGTGQKIEKDLQVNIRQPGVKLPASLPSVVVATGGKTTLNVAVERVDYHGPIELSINELPAGVQGQPLILQQGQTEGALLLQADGAAADAKQTSTLQAHIAGRPVGSPVAVVIVVGNPSTAVTRGQELLRKKQFESAQAEFKRAVQLNPAEAAAHIGLAEVALARESLDAAIAACAEALRIDKSSTAAYWLRGQAHYRKKSYDLALSDYEAAVRHGLKQPPIYNDQGLALTAHKEYTSAVKAFTQAVRLDPASAIYHANRGQAYALLKRFHEADEDFQKALELVPRCNLAYRNRGDARMSQEDWPAAVKDYTEAVRLDKQDAQAYFGRGQAQLHRKDYPTALADLEQVVQLGLKIAPVYTSRGQALIGVKNYERAVADLNEAVRLQYNFAPAYFHRARAYLATRDYAKALADSSAGIKHDGKSAEAYAVRAQVRYFLRQTEAAMQDCEDAIIIDNRCARAYLVRSWIYKVKSIPDKAQRDFDKAFQLDPGLARGN